jgi:hypothetical protein
MTGWDEDWDLTDEEADPDPDRFTPLDEQAT